MNTRAAPLFDATNPSTEKGVPRNWAGRGSHFHRQALFAALRRKELCAGTAGACRYLSPPWKPRHPANCIGVSGRWAAAILPGAPGGASSSLKHAPRTHETSHSAEQGVTYAAGCVPSTVGADR